MGPGGEDRGDTLVEILAAVSILGIGVVSLVTALAAMSKTTVANRGQARAETTLLAAAEYVKFMTLTSSDFSACGPAPATLTSSQVTLPTGFSAKYLHGSAATVGVPCANLIQIPVSVTGEGFTLQLSVVRRP